MPAQLIKADGIKSSYLDDAKAPRIDISDGLTATESLIKLNLGSGLDFDTDGKVVSNAVQGKLLRNIEAYMTFDNGFEDDLSTHTITKQGAGISRDSSSGKVNDGVSFGGTAGEHVDLGGALDPKGTAFTWTAWVKLNAGSPQDILRLAPQNKAIVLRWDGSNLGLYVFSDNSTLDNSATVSMNADGSTWYFVRVRKNDATTDGTDLMIRSEDAGSDTTATATISTNDRGAVVSHIGEDGNGPSAGSGTFSTDSTGALNGSVDEVGVWNRALTDAEMSILYASGTGSHEFLDFDQEWWNRVAQGDVNLNDNSITNLADPSNPQDGVNKRTLDAQAGTLQQLLRDIRLYYTFDNSNLNDFFRGYDGNDPNAGTGATEIKFDGSVKVIGSAAQFQYNSGSPSSQFSNGNAFHVRDKDFTVAFWIRPDADSTADETILTSDSGGGGTRLEVNYLGATAPKSLQVKMLDGGNNDTTLTSSSALSEDTWQHVVITRSGTTSDLYIDNDTSNGYSGETVPTGVISVADSSQVGAGTNNNFVGWLDELGVWERALTASEIDQLHNGGSGKQSFLDFSQTIQRKPSVEFVAASDAAAVERQVATFLCDGTDDDVEINAAIGAGNKTVMLSSGTFTISSNIAMDKDGLSLKGQGRFNTTIKRASGASAGTAVVTANSTNGKFSVQDMTIDGFRNGNTTLNGSAHGFGFKAELGAIRNIRVLNCQGPGIIATASGRDVVIDNCTVENCNGTGIDLNQSGNENIRVTNCYVETSGLEDGTDGSGYHLNGVETTLLNCQDRDSRTSFRVDVATSGHVSLSNCIGVTGEGNGVLVRGDNFLGSLIIDNCRLDDTSGTASYAVDLKDPGSNTGRNIHMSGTVVDANANTAQRIGDATRVTISGGDFEMGTGTDSLEITGGGSEQVTVMGAYLAGVLNLNNKTGGNAIITGCYLGNGVNDTNTVGTLTGNVDAS